MNNTGKVRILIVDDSSSSRSLLRSQLAKKGYDSVTEVAGATEALAALEQARKENAPLSLIFCDWNMPGMSGLELLQVLQATPVFRAVPVIMFTTEGGFEQIKEAIGAGATNYLSKPYAESALFEKLDFVVQKYRLGKS